MGSHEKIEASEIKAKGTAPGQYLGYALQPVRLFHHLLKCPSGAAVGLEYIDDVSVHVGGETVLVEQCKSATSTNPVSNWSVDLWKTFSNWIDNVTNGLINPKNCIFRLYVTPAKTGTFVQKLNDLKDADEIKKTLKDIADRRKKLSKEPVSETFLTKFLATDESLLVPIIQNFEFVSCDVDPIQPAREHLAATVRESIVEAACQYGIGEAKREVDEEIRSSAQPLLDADTFRNRFVAFISAHDSERFLHSLSDSPSDEVVEATIAEAPMFVRQLELVNADIEMKSRAAGDFLRSSRDRTVWAEEGIIFKDSLDDYDNQLKRRHSNLKTEIEITKKSLTDEDKGRLLYAKCCNADPIAIEQRALPVHFMPGSLNALADICEIGWHPNYTDFFENGEDG